MNKLHSLLLFFAISIVCFSQEKVIDQVVAIVGNDIVLKSDIENQYLQFKAQGYYSDGDLKCEILEEMLFQKLMLNQARVDSIEVTDSQVDQALEQRLSMFISQIGSEEKLEEYFDKTILEIKEDLRDVLREQLMTQQMQSTITEDVKITPSDVKSYFKSLPKDSIPMIESEMEIAEIVIRPPINSKQKEVIRGKLDDIRQRIIDGSSFKTMAVLYSEDPGSSTNGGDLGEINRTDVVPEFAAAAFSLENPGDLSKIIETEFGFHLIQLEEKKGERVHCRHILMSPKVAIEDKIAAEQKLDSIAGLIRTDQLSFKEAAEKFSEEETSKNNGGLIINENSGTSKWESSELDKNTYYAIKNLEIGEISKVFETKTSANKSDLKIVSIRSKTKPHVANLKDDYLKLQEFALAKKKQKAINDWITDKQKSTYIHLDDSYANCSFRNEGWKK